MLVSWFCGFIIQFPSLLFCFFLSIIPRGIEPCDFPFPRRYILTSSAFSQALGYGSFIPASAAGFGIPSFHQYLMMGVGDTRQAQGIVSYKQRKKIN